MEIEINIENELDAIKIFINSIKNPQHDESFNFSSLNLKEKGIVYFIFITNKETKLTELKYIGKSRGRKFQNRMKNHFVKPNKGTQTKHEFIISEEKKGNICSFNYIKTKPESLRNMIEEELINYYTKTHNLWNNKSIEKYNTTLLVTD